MYLLLINLSKPRSLENLAQNPAILNPAEPLLPRRDSPQRSIIDVNRGLDPIQEAPYNLVMNNRISSKTPTMGYRSFYEDD